MKIKKDMVLFITGGASGLGEATVRHFYQFGCRIALVDQSDKRLESLSKEMPGLLCIKCDVTKEEQVKDAVQQTADKWGTINVVLTCAGVNWPSLTLSKKAMLDVKHY